ncbi:hypothetical protein J6590_050349 [Homalodisca vitripennis]|nr:hypothetical protein J6590_050349 [Homalodisca vitripennis]
MQSLQTYYVAMECTEIAVGRGGGKRKDLPENSKSIFEQYGGPFRERCRRTGAVTTAEPSVGGKQLAAQSCRPNRTSASTEPFKISSIA